MWLVYVSTRWSIVLVKMDNWQLPQPSAEHKHVWNHSTHHLNALPPRNYQSTCCKNLSSPGQTFPSLSSNWFRTEILDPSVSFLVHGFIHPFPGFSPSTVSLFNLTTSHHPTHQFSWDNQTWFPLKDGISTGTFLDTYLESTHPWWHR